MNFDYSNADGATHLIPAPAKVALCVELTPPMVTHCTTTETSLWVSVGDPDCVPFAAIAKCFSDGSETFSAVAVDGTAFSNMDDLMSNATPYSAPVLTTVSVKDELRNFHFVAPAGGFVGTTADLITLALAATPVTIQLPSEAAPVAVTSAETCSWMIDVQPCFAELATGEIVPEGADFAFIGGLKATGDGDAATAGADVTTAIDAPAGAILTLCVSFERTEQAKA